MKQWAVEYLVPQSFNMEDIIPDGWLPLIIFFLPLTGNNYFFAGILPTLVHT